MSSPTKFTDSPFPIKDPGITGKQRMNLNAIFFKKTQLKCEEISPIFCFEASHTRVWSNRQKVLGLKSCRDR